jgi:hypothetical protein
MIRHVGGSQQRGRATAGQAFLRDLRPSPPRETSEERRIRLEANQAMFRGPGRGEPSESSSGESRRRRRRDGDRGPSPSPPHGHEDDEDHRARHLRHHRNWNRTARTLDREAIEPHAHGPPAVEWRGTARLSRSVPRFETPFEGPRLPPLPWYF